MSDEKINEFFYTVQNHFASHTSQRKPTWEEIAARQAQASIREQVYNFREVNSFNNAVISLNPIAICQATIVRVGGHKRISPT